MHQQGVVKNTGEGLNGFERKNLLRLKIQGESRKVVASGRVGFV